MIPSLCCCTCSASYSAKKKFKKCDEFFSKFFFGKDPPPPSGLLKASWPDRPGSWPDLSGRTRPDHAPSMYHYMHAVYDYVRVYANQLNSLLVQYSIIKVRCNSKHCVALVHSTLALCLLVINHVEVVHTLCDHLEVVLLARHNWTGNKGGALKALPSIQSTSLVSIPFNLKIQVLH